MYKAQTGEAAKLPPKAAETVSAWGGKRNTHSCGEIAAQFKALEGHGAEERPQEQDKGHKCDVRHIVTTGAHQVAP